MKKTVLTFTLAASVLALGACNGQQGSDVLATSKIGDFTKDELYQEMKSSVGGQAFQVLAIEKVLANKYKVTDEEVDAQVDKAKEQMGENFQSFLDQRGYSEDSFRKSQRLNILQERALTDGIEVPEADVKKAYEHYKTELKARHILVPDEATAKKVKKELEAGGDFAALAKKYSTEQAAKQTGGDLGWFGPGKMVKEFEDAAYKLEKNKISEPVKSEFGYHIIQVTDKRDIKEPKSFEEKKEQLALDLKIAKADQSKLLPKVTKMLKEADIQIKDKDLKTSLDSLFQQAGEAAPGGQAPEPSKAPQEKTGGQR